MDLRTRSPQEAWASGVPAVICHDAGAAAHVIAWIASDRGPRRKAIVYFEGPAKRLAEARGLRVAVSLEDALGAAQWALVGTGWQSNLELRAMQRCAAIQLPCVAAVDHWVNYRERFSGLRADERPQTIVVTDPAAEELALRQLSWATVVRWPNEQLGMFLREFKHRQLSPVGSDAYLLWLNEPIRQVDGQLCDPLVDPRFAPTLWDCVRRVAGARSLGRIVVRGHPSEQLGSHHSTNSSVEFRDAGTTTLAADVAGARVCLGINSYGLYLAAHAGIETLSIAASLGLPERLPRDVVKAY